MSDESKTEEEQKIGWKILGFYIANNMGINEGFATTVLHQSVYLRLNPKEQELYEAAIQRLVDNGYLNRNSADSLVLTKKGVNIIYPSKKLI